jgi:MoxR-like ATPase
MSALVELERQLQESLSGTVIGMQNLIRALLTATVSRGHVLVQGAPGLGKTLLGKTLAAALGGRFTRVQGTADLMPSDITGVHVFDESTRKFVLQPGPIFTDILLVDEINRAGPKTQSALLEAMAERQVSIDRTTHRLPPGFLVIATQNPHEFEGTYPLPESQLDRFMLRVELGYPSDEDESAVLDRYGTVSATGETAPERTPRPPVVAPEQLEAARRDVDEMHVSAEVTAYVLAIAKATRDDPHIALGLSTRGALALLRAARVAAALRGSSFVTPDDVKLMAPWVIAHRLTLSAEAALERRKEQALVRSILERVPVPR